VPRGQFAPRGRLESADQGFEAVRSAVVGLPGNRAIAAHDFGLGCVQSVRLRRLPATPENLQAPAGTLEWRTAIAETAWFPASRSNVRRLRLVIIDNGKGFQFGDVNYGSGLGLVSIEESARLLRGSSTISSMPGADARCGFCSVGGGVMGQGRIVLADDHTIMLEGLKELLAPRFDLLATAANGIELMEKIRELKPDVAVTDIAMPIMNGINVLREIKAAGFSTQIVFLTANPDITLATQALQLGAAGYVLKASASAELLEAIHAALEGKTYISPSIALDVQDNLAHCGGKQEGPPLTSREMQVLQLLAEGKSLKETAAILNVSPRTVEFHRNNITDKTGLRSIAELSRYAARHGLVVEEA